MVAVIRLVLVGYSYWSRALGNQQAVLEFLATTKIGEKGQVTVPKEFRDHLGLQSGAPFAVLRLGNGLILMPQQGHFDQLCSRIGSALTSVGLTSKAVLETLPQSRQRVYQRRYGAPERKSSARKQSAR